MSKSPTFLFTKDLKTAFGKVLVPVTLPVKRGIMSKCKTREGQTDRGRETETLWEVIALPVLAVAGQPSETATSLCPSAPRLSVVLLQA